MFNPLLGRLAKRLAELTPGDLKISFFANSGTEAVEGALKLARAATERTKLVGTHDAFHGKTLRRALGQRPRGVSRTVRTAARRRRARAVRRSRRAGRRRRRCGGRSSSSRCKARAASTCRRRSILRGVRELCDRAGAVFIADEVQTGLGRCGALFACDLAGVVPDVMTLAKGLSGGVVPIGAYIARARHLERRVRQGTVAAHVDLRRQRAGLCGGARRARRARRRRSRRQRARPRRRVARRRARDRRTLPRRDCRGARRSDCSSVSSCATKAMAVRSSPNCCKRGVTAAWTLNQQRVIRLEPPLIVDAAQIATALQAFDEAAAVALERLGVLACPT